MFGGLRNWSGTSSERPEAVIRNSKELSVLDILLFDPLSRTIQKMEETLKSIMNIDKFNKDNFQTDNEIDEWIATRHKVMFKDATNID